MHIVQVMPLVHMILVGKTIQTYCPSPVLTRGTSFLRSATRSNFQVPIENASELLTKLLEHVVAGQLIFDVDQNQLLPWRQSA